MDYLHRERWGIGIAGVTEFLRDGGALAEGSFSSSCCSLTAVRNVGREVLVALSQCKFRFVCMRTECVVAGAAVLAFCRFLKILRGVGLRPRTYLSLYLRRIPGTSFGCTSGATASLSFGNLELRESLRILYSIPVHAN